MRSDNFYFNRISIVQVLFIILALGFLIYSNTFQSGFHLDDLTEIINNSAIRNFFDWNTIWAYNKQRFIPYLTFAFNYQLSGLNLLGYHILNILIHVSCSLLVFSLTELIFKTPKMKEHSLSGYSRSFAFLAALIFLVHPIQTESVTYIVQRYTSLATFFYLGTVCAYAKGRLERKKLWYFMAFLSAFMATFSKEISYTLLFTLLLFEFCFFTDSLKIFMKRTGVLLLFLMPLSFLYLFYYKNQIYSGGLASVTRMDSDLPRTVYLLTQFNVIRTYIRLFFLPVHQNFDYDYPLSTHFFEWRTIASFGLITILLFIACKTFAKNRLLSFGIFWFFLALSIESSIFPIKDLIMEHRMYLPLFGGTIVFLSVLQILLKYWSRVEVVGLIIVLVLGSMTYRRNIIWGNEFSLWQDVVRKSPNKSRPHNNYGIILAKHGRFEEAEAHLKKALEINRDPSTLNNFGRLLTMRGEPKEAIEVFDEAIKEKPDFAQAYDNKGTALSLLAEYKKAIESYNMAIQLESKNAQFYNNMAVTYLSWGKQGEGLRFLNKALTIDPYNSDALANQRLAQVRRITE